ncbi:peptide chain release factor N(5)-glutamine methyltransferase [Agrococcus sp. SGAir0287]|uniref:peptide chain release factor N(5)-glutamine methyltransferase n=1 Tax=Agrococcus sp. SGAir0287 TaxID=2070347 RepID=UPI0010CD0CD4|nr:peptide chain release factor N(5)-glutamine methyltransferase [Agrococcus sp. SGAir0287]
MGAAPGYGAEVPDLRATVTAARDALARVGVEGPDAEVLAAHVLGTTLGDLRMRMLLGADLEEEDARTLGALVARRGEREPLQHLTGEAHFRHATLAVGPGVFTPRPETEVLVDHALAMADAAGRAPIVVDACAGSGAVAIAIATERTDARVLAVELSDDAIAWTRRNVAALAPAIELVQGDVAELDALLPAVVGAVDVLVSNPPYVPTAAVPRDAEVRLHDPALALYSGDDGLDVVRALASVGARMVRDGGGIALEHGEEQGGAVRAVLAAAGWHEATTHPDLTGRDRVTTARR